MRISGGQWRGRALLMPKSDLVRPTQDRVREALFSLLQPVLPGARFLDLFAGSGAVGLEALSRGAREATFFERDRAVFATLLRNLAAFGVDASNARQADVCVSLGGVEGAGHGSVIPAGGAASRTRASSATPPCPSPGRPVPHSSGLRASMPPFDIVFADPPYLWARENGFAGLARAVVGQGWLVPGGFFVAECDHRTAPGEIPGFTLLRDRTYGKTRVAVWRVAGAAADGGSRDEAGGAPREP